MKATTTTRTEKIPNGDKKKIRQKTQHTSQTFLSISITSILFYFIY